MADIKLRDMIETVELTTEDLNGGSYKTKDKVFYDTLKDVENINNRERIAYVTDYAVMNYGLLASSKAGYKDKKPTWYWLRSASSSSNVINVNSAGCGINTYSNKTDAGARPALHLNLSSYISARSASRDFSKIEIQKNKGINDYHTLTLGEYPKTYVGNKLDSTLESCSRSKTIKATGKKWPGYQNDDGIFVQNEEFEYNGEKYVRVKTKRYDGDSEYSDGTKAPEDGAYKWVKVEPITWKIRNWDEMPREINPNGSGKAKFIDIQTEEGIASGVPFSKDRKTTLWKDSTIRQFLNNEFLQQAFNVDKISVKDEILENIETRRLSRLERMNPDKTPVSLRRKMTDTEIIESWIDAGQSVLLRGPSGIGKTERIKTLYPDLIYIKLTNNMFPEKVVGSMNLQTGQAIPPDFAKQALLSCATDEERKLINENIQNLYEYADQIYERSKTSTGKVVILLDELLNVKPAVQSLVYTLVLNKLVETGKGLKLPANTVVVGTGNQKKYSGVAEDLAEPLEKRFDHIMDMEPKVGEWIYEYAIPNKIHPSVIGYVFSKYQQNQKSEEIKDMGYFYEEPEVGESHLDKNGCKGRTNDPRGWTSISRMLYSFENDLESEKFVGKDVSNLLQTSIDSKLRDEWAGEFFDFYKNPTLSVEEVVGKKYSQADLPRDINEKFATMAGLLSATDKQVGTCREFIKKHCGPEYVSAYDICWPGHDEARMEKISELQKMSMVNEGGRTL